MHFTYFLRANILSGLREEKLLGSNHKVLYSHMISTKTLTCINSTTVDSKLAKQLYFTKNNNLVNNFVFVLTA